jgi:pimeloyl-ACP methyl ester carboxylesterase
MTTHEAVHKPRASEAAGASSAPTRFATTKGRTIAYRSIGDGPAILLCNRYRGTLDTWDPMFLDELARSFTVITFDYSGIGRSTGEPPSTIAALAQDAKDLADALGLARFVIGGWSMGGIAAEAFIVKWPGSATHAILIGASPPGPNAHPLEPIFLEIALKPDLDLQDETVAFFEPRSEASRVAAQRSHDRIARRTTDLDPVVAPEVFTRVLQSIATDAGADSEHVREAIQKTSVPILIVSGDHDIAFPVENWYALSGKLPTAQHIVFPVAGHGPQHQYPEAAAEHIRTFIRATR